MNSSDHNPKEKDQKAAYKEKNLQVIFLTYFPFFMKQSFASSAVIIGLFMSANGMVLRLGQTLGPIIMGAIYVLWGVSGTFLAGAVLSIVMIFLIKILIK